VITPFWHLIFPQATIGSAQSSATKIPFFVASFNEEKREAFLVV
jgi:hypothetical protein